MKIFRVGLFLAALSVCGLQAKDVLVEAKGAYFYPTNSKFRHIYGNGVGLFGVEVTPEIWQRWYGFASVDWAATSGTSIGLGTYTSVTLLPIAAGVKYIYDINERWDWYVGLGGQGTWIQTRDHSSFVHHTISKWSWGGIIKTGFLINTDSKWFFDIFGSYCLMTSVGTDTKPFKTGFITGGHADPSGFAGGIGIGYRFGCKDQPRCCTPYVAPPCR